MGTQNGETHTVPAAPPTSQPYNLQGTYSSKPVLNLCCSVTYQLDRTDFRMLTDP